MQINLKYSLSLSLIRSFFKIVSHQHIRLANRLVDLKLKYNKTLKPTSNVMFQASHNRW